MLVLPIVNSLLRFQKHHILKSGIWMKSTFDSSSHIDKSNPFIVLILIGLFVFLSVFDSAFFACPLFLCLMTKTHTA